MHLPKSLLCLVSLCLLLIGASRSAAGQSGSITGVVTDRASNEPISGVQVAIEGTTRGTTTAENGRFTIPQVDPGTYAITVRRVGYVPTTRRGVVVAAGAPTTVDVALDVAVLRLQSMVVTGVTDPTEGVRAPFSVGRVATEDIKSVPTVNSAAAAIQGKVAGVQVIRGSGQPGDGVSVQLRTPVNIQVSNSPMYVVDGVILGSNFNGTTVDLEALDIESIEVIKGAAAASLYGSRAANGVVSITTSRGLNLDEGETRISARSEIGTSSTPRNVPLNRHHHYKVDAQGNYLDDAGNVVTIDDRVDDPDGIADNPFAGRLYDNLGALFQPAAFVTMSTNISQNAQATNFLLSLNQKTERGALENNDGFIQRTFRVNLDHRMRENLNFRASVFHSRGNQDQLSGSPFWDILMFQPDISLLERDTTGQYARQPDPLYAEFENPLWRQASRDWNIKRARTLSALDARYSPLSWLSLSTNLSYDRADILDDFYLPKGTPNSLTSDREATGEIEKEQETSDALNGSITATALWNFGGLTTRFTATGLAERENNATFTATGSDLFVVGVPDLSVAATRDVSSSRIDIRSEGYLGSVALDYEGKYVVDGLVRRDGSSLFGPANRWNNYYRVSTAYLISEEPWWPVTNLDLFKFRYSIGTAGSRPGFSSQYETWSVDGSDGSVTKGTLGNQNLRPSHTTEQEFGIDFIIKNRYSVELNYVRQRTKDQLIQLELPAVTGYTQQWRNSGVQSGTTYEATMQANIVNRPTFSWNATLIADHSDSKIEEWPTTCEPDDLRFICTGNSLAKMYGARHIRSVRELPAVHAGSQDQFQVNDDGYLVPVGPGGDFTQRRYGEFVTIDGVQYQWGNPILQQNPDGTEWFGEIGSSLADVNLGYLNNIRWRGFTLHTQLHAQIGGQVYNNTRQRLYQHNRHGDVDQTGKPEELKKPISYYTAIYNRNDYTQAFVEPGSYLKLRELALQYRVGRDQMTRIGLGAIAPEGISFGIIGRNLWTSTKYRGYDPEVGSPLNREDSFTYPPTRTLTGSVEINF